MHTALEVLGRRNLDKINNLDMLEIYSGSPYHSMLWISSEKAWRVRTKFIGQQEWSPRGCYFLIGLSAVTGSYLVWSSSFDAHLQNALQPAALSDQIFHVVGVHA